MTYPLPPGRTGWLLLDVDGPLHPWKNKGCHRPEGYSSYRLTKHGHWYTGRDFRRFKGLCVWLRPDIGPRVLALAERTGLALAWATTWLEDANRHVAPTLGLPELPVVPFGPPDLVETRDGLAWDPFARWKYGSVAEWAGDVPLAWWDDEFGHRRYADARREFEAARAGTATLLCDVDPGTGLLDGHFEQVEAWAAGLR
jgi:hypothetical protein